MFALQIFPSNLTWDQQELLVAFTYKSELNKKLPIKLAYQLNFFKKLISLLETNSKEVHDLIYESYCEIQQRIATDATEKYAFKHYLLSPNEYLTLRESKSFVADGTTGLCSWQASLALADFLVAKKSSIENKTILELGSGTGLCGFIVAKLCRPKHFLLSDGSVSCVQLMLEAIETNFPERTKLDEFKFSLSNCILECCILPWSDIDSVQEVCQLKPEILLAADVVYDDTVFNDLSYAIDFAFKLRSSPQVEMYLAATVRNGHTLNGFLEKMSELLKLTLVVFQY